MTTAERFSLPIVLDPGVGPFTEGLELELLSGLNLFQWENGEGKTLVLNVIAAAAKEKLVAGDLPIAMPGVELSAKIGQVRLHGRKGGRPLSEGELGMPVEFVPDPIQDLVTGGGHSGAKPALRARLRALATWTQLGLTEEAHDVLLGPDDRMERFAGAMTLGDDLLDGVKDLRIAIHGSASVQETRLGEWQQLLSELAGKRTAILEGLDEAAVIAITEPEVGKKESFLMGATTAAAGLSVQRQERREEQARRASRLVDMGERPVTDELHSELGVESTAHLTVQRTTKALIERRNRLTEQIQTSQTAEAAALAVVERIQAQLAEREAAQSSWESERASLEEELEIPTAEAVETANSVVEEAATAVGLHKAAEKLLPVAAEAEDARDRASELEADWEFLKEEVDAVWVRLATLINSMLKSMEIRVEGEEVQILVDGTWRNIANDPKKPDEQWVSEGTRFAACYRLMLAHRHGQRIINIENSTTVGPEHSLAIGQLAIEKGILLNMETAVNAVPGEYTVIHFPPRA